MFFPALRPPMLFGALRLIPFFPTPYLPFITTSSEVQIPKQVRDDNPSGHSGMILARIRFVQLLKRTISILGKIDP